MGKKEKLKDQTIPQKEIPYIADKKKAENHSGFISKMEAIRKNYEKSIDSKLLNKEDELSTALNEIYGFIKKETGYRPSWLVDALDFILNKSGRPALYGLDEKILGSQFIHLLIQNGSSKTQAINLLGILRGNATVTEGFAREFRETYNEYYESNSNPLSIIDMGIILGQIATNTSLEKIKQTKSLIRDSHIALTKICQKIIDHIRENKEMVEKFDLSHKQQHNLLIKMMLETHNDPCLYFFYETINPDSEGLNSDRKILRERCRQIADYLHTVELASQKAELKARK